MRSILCISATKSHKLHIRSCELSTLVEVVPRVSICGHGKLSSSSVESIHASLVIWWSIESLEHPVHNKLLMLAVGNDCDSLDSQNV